MARILAATHLLALLAPALLLALPPEVSLPLATALSFLHFAATLVLFYAQPRLRARHPRVAWALPAALGALLVGWALVHGESLARWLVFFFVFLFWHYAKQSYGFFVLSFRGVSGFDDPKSPARQATLLYFLFTALFGFLSTQTTGGTTLSFGLYVPNLGLAPGPVEAIGRAGAALGLAFCAVLCWRHRRFLPFATALSFYLWADLRLFDYRLLGVLPALHALQYFPIVGARAWRGGGTRWLGLAAVGGAGLFLALRGLPRVAFWSLAAMGALELTLNLHHYFIDAYIWRFREPSIRGELGG